MDAETRRKMKRFVEQIEKQNKVDPLTELEIYTDWVYDLAYRKGWNHGFWRQEADISHQIECVSLTV